MAVRVTVEFELDVDHWDEAVPVGLYARTVLETLAGRVERSCSGSGCDLYGVFPVTRADGERIGSWQMWDASAEEA